MDADNKLYELLNVSRNASDAEIKKVRNEKHVGKKFLTEFPDDEIQCAQGRTFNIMKIFSILLELS